MIDAGLEVGGVDPYVRSGCDPGHALHIFPTTDEPAAAVGEPTGRQEERPAPTLRRRYALPSMNNTAKTHQARANRVTAHDTARASIPRFRCAPASVAR